MAVALVSRNKMFGGWQQVFSHQSAELKCKMSFGIFLPTKTEQAKCPVLYWLSGLTCTEQNFVTKAGVQKYANEHGIVVVAPDTSPRDCNIEGEGDSYDFGTGAGFYIDATVDKWKTNYRMYSYITSELPQIIQDNFPVIPDCQSIFGHSMGGHGALTIFLKNPGKYRSVSAFAPITNPCECPWGQKAFSGYLGNTDEDKLTWKKHDATCLAAGYNGPPADILIDQGKDDQFLTQSQLLPENFISATSKNSHLSVTLRMQEGYDHSYFFIASFMEDHIKHHANFLNTTS